MLWTSMKTVTALTLTLIAGCQATGGDAVSGLPAGSSFTVAQIDGNPAPDGVTFEIGEDGRVFGAGPCNRYSGQMSQQNGVMTIGGIVSTRMACLDAGRNLAETRFHTALGVVTGTSGSGDGIALIDGEGRTRILLQRD